MKYMIGTEKFVCSSCFAKDPKKVAIERTSESVERPAIGQVIMIEAEIHSTNSNEDVDGIEVIDTEEVSLEETVINGAPDNDKEGFWATDHVDILSCEKCSMKFPSSEELKDHMKTIHEVACFICKECQFKSTTKTELDVHLDSLIKCKECTVIHHSEDSLKIHMENEHRGNNLKCDACSFVTTTQELLGKHIVDSHSNLSPPQSPIVGPNSPETSVETFPCDICNRTLNSLNEFNNHKKVH